MQMISPLGLWFGTVGLIGYPAIALAQSVPPPGIQLPPNTDDRVEETIPTPLPTAPPTSSPPTPLEFPPIPESNPAAPDSQATRKIKVIQIAVIGNTIFKSEINEIIKPYIGKEINFEDLIKLRADITKLYIDNGYLNSGAFIPNNQNLLSGDIQVQVVEGELERIEIVGLRRLREGYVRKRLENATTAPLNKSRLERALQLLQIDPLIDQVNAELTAGSSPGRNILRIALKEAPALHGGITIDNTQAKSVGTLQGTVFLSHDNLLGLGDRLFLEYGRTEGLSLYGITYTLPLNPKDGTLTLRYGKNNSQIVEEVFEDLGIRSNSETISASIRQPLTRSPNTEFAIGMGFDLRRSETFLLDDIPFSFSEGPEDGRSKVAVLRFFQDWVDRDSNSVLAARSQFSIGLNLFDATSNSGDIPDGQFVTWLGQFQWVQQISPRVVVVSRLAAQLANDRLLSLERISLGGSDTVRGYRQNQLVSDNAILGSIEVRIPITRNPALLQLTPFIDWGYGWNQGSIEPSPSWILSTGVGLRSRLWEKVDAQLDFGIPLSGRDEIDAQPFQFSLRYQPF